MKSMTCTCHDPVVYGHLGCSQWETQPRGRHILDPLPWDPYQYHRLARSIEALTEALTAAGNCAEAFQTTQNTIEAFQTTIETRP